MQGEWLLVSLAVPGHSFGGRSTSSIKVPRGVGFGEGCAPPQKIFGLFASEWCILHAFWRMIRHFTTPILIRLKPAKSSYIYISSPNRAKSSSGYVLVAFVCLFVSRIRLSEKLWTDFDEIFWSGGVYPRKKWSDFGTNYHNYRQESQHCKTKWGLGGGLHSLSASDVLLLAALFHSDNLVKME